MSEDVSAPRGEHGSAASSAASRSGRPTSTDAARRPSVYPSRSSGQRADPQAGGKVGAQLLQRTPRSVSISDAGAVMLHEARRVVQQRRSSGGGPCGPRPADRTPTASATRLRRSPRVSSARCSESPSRRACVETTFGRGSPANLVDVTIWPSMTCGRSRTARSLPPRVPPLRFRRACPRRAGHMPSCPRFRRRP